MFFRGVKNLNLDAKGRIAMPPKYREFLAASCGGELIVTVNHCGCLMIYPLPEWEVREKQLIGAASIDRQVQDLQRFYVGFADDTSLDAQGRILIPPSLRAYAELDKQVVLVGQGHRFELWDEKRWADYQASCQKSVSGMEGGELPESLRHFSF